MELLHANELAVVLNFLTRKERKGPPIPAPLLARLLVRATAVWLTVLLLLCRDEK